MSDNDQPIIVKKIKKAGHGHHGGAWKVAYADFVTAMMAFFLLMWLINTTSPEQKRGIADYFAPASISKTTSGSGGLFGGLGPAEQGARGEGSTAANIVKRQQAPKSKQTVDTKDEAKSQDSDSKDKVDQDPGAEPDTIDEPSSASDVEHALFTQAELSLRQALQDVPELTELSKHLLVDQTPEGLRIQIVDQEGRPMFPPGGVEPYDRTKRLLEAVSEVIVKLPNRISISGHTDANPTFRPDGSTDWELSAARANASRRILQMSGVPSDRIYSVAGKAASEPLYPEDPFQPANRRVSIVLLREAPVLPPKHSL